MADLYAYEFVTPITVSGTNWSLSGTTITCTRAPVGERTTATLSVYSSLGGYLKVDSAKFDLSVDGITWDTEQYVDAGTSTVYLGVTPQAGDYSPRDGINIGAW